MTIDENDTQALDLLQALPKSNRQRQQDYRDRQRDEQLGKRLDVMLDKETWEKLDRIAKFSAESKKDTLFMIISTYYREIRDSKDFIKFMKKQNKKR